MVNRHDMYVASFLAASVLEVALLVLHNPIGLVLVLPWALLLIKTATT